MSNQFQIDPSHSSLQFSVRHLMVSNVRGAFTGVHGTVIYDPANPTQSKVEATIDADTIKTNDEKRDEHLKSAEFFNVAEFPEITFRSTKILKKEENSFSVTGDLTLHGVTKPVALDVEDVTGEAKDPWGNIRIGATVKAKIKRSDFGLTWNAALETGGVLVGDEIKLDFELEFIKAQTAAA
jgi:polyisoprenoid-binding protein YceI